VTLSNHTKRIEELAGAVTTLCDSRKYEEAHCALDDIESKVHALRRHVDDCLDRQRDAARLAGALPL